MNERFKGLARLGIAAGLAVGGALQTAEIVNQHGQIDSLRQSLTDQQDKSSEQRLDIMDLKNNECWDWNFIQKLVETVAGIPGPGIVDCDVAAPLGHQPTPTVPGKGG